nr:immunoglobulin light chain junction region [Macaca mulatta]
DYYCLIWHNSAWVF